MIHSVPSQPCEGRLLMQRSGSSSRASSSNEQAADESASPGFLHDFYQGCALWESLIFSDRVNLAVQSLLATVIRGSLVMPPQLAMTGRSSLFIHEGHNRFLREFIFFCRGSMPQLQRIEQVGNADVLLAGLAREFAQRDSTLR